MIEGGVKGGWRKKFTLEKEINIFFVLKSNCLLFLAVVHRARSTGHASTHTLNTLHTFSTLTRRKAALQLMSSHKPNSCNVSKALRTRSRARCSTGCCAALRGPTRSPTRSASQQSSYRHISNLFLKHSAQRISAAHLRVFPQILTNFIQFIDSAHHLKMLLWVLLFILLSVCSSLEPYEELEALSLILFPFSSFDPKLTGCLKHFYFF